MIVAIHQPNYLPYLGFFHKLAESDVLVLYDTAQFSKNEYHNRNRIKTPRGSQWITVPVHSPFGKAIRDVEIDRSKPWAEKHLLSLRANYSRAPHFATLIGILSEHLGAKWTRLADLNSTLVRRLAELLGVRAKLVHASALSIRPGLSPTEKILEMVRSVGGTTYLSGPGGRNYLEVSRFTEIELAYDDFIHPEYPQLFGPFVPSLSVVDAIFNCGVDRVRSMLAA